MKKWSFITAVILTAQLAAFGTPVLAATAGEVQRIVDKARITVSDFTDDKNYTWLHENLRKAKGVLIFPEVLKGGFFWGGSGGTGVLVVKDEKTDEWSQPAFYSVGSVTFGLQIGAEKAEVVMLAMNQRAIDTLFASSFKFGGSVSVAAGPYGGGAEKAVTADFISFAKAKGLYAGLNFEGSGVQVRGDLNGAYYGRDVRPLDIIVRKEVSNRGSEDLLAALRKAVK